MARDAAGGVGGPQGGGLGRLGYSSRPGFSERTLALEPSGLSLSDQDVGSVAELLGLFHEVLRRLAHCLRLESNFGGKHRAAVHMRAGARGQVATTARA